MQNNAARFWASKMSRYKRFVVKADVVKSNVYCVCIWFLCVDKYVMILHYGYWLIPLSRRSLMDDGIVEIRPTNFDFSQILIVMLN